VNSFKDHYRKFRKDGTAVKRRHVDSMFTSNATDPNMKHANDIVPVCHRANNNAVQPFEELKRVGRGSKPITGVQANTLAKQFGFNIPSQANEEVKCGNTGISMTLHPTNPNSYLLYKR
jgi:hypothetical protein